MTLVLVACGGGSGSSAPPIPAAKYSVSGTVTGLLGTGLVLQNNDGDDLPIASNGSFSFATSLAAGAKYSVSIKSQSNILTRACTVSNGSGNISNANITDLLVNCSSPAARFAYVVNARSNDIFAYTINATSGALTHIGTTTAAPGSNPYSVAVSPNGRFAYAANMGSNNISAYTIDATTGALSPIDATPVKTGTSPITIAVDPSGRFAYVANLGSNDISAYTIDATTGALEIAP